MAKNCKDKKNLAIMYEVYPNVFNDKDQGDEKDKREKKFDFTIRAYAGY